MGRLPILARHPIHKTANQVWLIHYIRQWRQHPFLGERGLYEVSLPSFFAICSDVNIVVSTTLKDGNCNISIRRTFGPAETVAWRPPLGRSFRPLFRDGRISSLLGTGSLGTILGWIFLWGIVWETISSLVLLLILWKASTPLKIKVFLWQLLRHI